VHPPGELGRPGFVSSTALDHTATLSASTKRSIHTTRRNAHSTTTHSVLESAHSANSNWNCVNSSWKCVSSRLPSALTSPFWAFRARRGPITRKKCVSSIWNRLHSNRTSDEIREKWDDSSTSRLISNSKSHKTKRKRGSARKKGVFSS
jgi:hypothetical protein